LRIRKFYGYKAHLNYLDYFVKTDVAMREGQMHPSAGGHQKQQQQQQPEKKEGNEDQSKPYRQGAVKDQEQEH
jgi:hypothetical protein